MVAITVFEADPADDERFVADWRRERAQVAGAVLLRALRADADFRFVELAPEAVPSPTGSYEVIHEEGDVDGAGGALLVDAFEVAPAADERFLAGWREACAARAGRRGYLGTRLHRARGPAALRWIDLARWSSPLMVQRARLQDPPARVPFASHAALYLPVARTTAESVRRP